MGTGSEMTYAAETSRLSLGSMLGAALALTRRRWLELLGLIVCIDWAPRVILTLSGVGRYTLGSHDEGAFAASALESALLELCSVLMLASVVALGLGGSRQPRSAPAAIAVVLRRLPALAPWWLAIAVPNAVTVWLRWSVDSPNEMRADYYWREFGGAAYHLALFCTLGLFSYVVLAEGSAGLAAVRRTFDLMAGRRGAVFVVAFVAAVFGLIVNLSTPYFAALAMSIGVQHDYQSAYYFVWSCAAFLGEVVSAVVNLVLVQLYLELARSCDGVAPGELDHIFA
jgi:hypothetical protein